MHVRSRFTLVMMAILLMIGMVGIQPSKPVEAAATDLFISEYIEGSSHNKAVEIYNGTGSPVSLANYQVLVFSNGSTSPSTITLSGTLAHGDVYVVAHPSANASILDVADLTSFNLSHNGDDAVALRNTVAGKYADVIGQVGLDPGSAWGTEPITTANHTLVRKCAIDKGDTSGLDPFNPADEWDSYDVDTTTYLGSHTVCWGSLSPVINEFSASTVGTEVEFVEFFGSPNTDYSAYTLLGIEGDANATNSSEGFVDNIIPLGTTDANGFYLVNLAANTLENGTLSLLLVKNSTAVIGDDIDTNDDGVIDVTYWSEITDGVAVNDGGTGDLTYATPVLGVAYDGFAFAPGGASRIPDGHDTDTSADWVRNDFDLAGIPGYAGTIVAGEAYNTPGATNRIYVEEAPTVISTSPENNGNHPIDENITITFSEPVTVTDPWFSIVCTVSGSHSAAVVDNDPVYTLNPEVDFTVGETCTVTIIAANVVDDDTDDAVYDAMEADYVFNFNAVTPPERCGDEFTPIYDIQGSGASSPKTGQTVTTEGVVVGDFQVGGKAGYYIQDPTGDNNTATSDGIFIYNTATDVNVGDHVRVRGKVVEFYEMTEISPVDQVWICSSGHTITPTEVTLPVEAVSDFEKYEGMLVTFPQSLIISEYFNFDRYGEIVLTSQRHMTPTAFVEPGADAQAAAQAYLLDRITLDDGRTAQNPDPAIHPNRQVFNMDNLFRGGGTVTGVTGVMDYYKDLYCIQPTTGATYADANPRTAAPDIVEADVKVASFNVLNYFVTLDGGSSAWICGPSGTMECRGADTAEEFDRQRTKILAALSAIDADIFGLMEIENEHLGGGDAVADLVAGLNEIKGPGTYAYITTGAIGTDAIKQAILYKPAAVTPVGEYKILTSSVDPRFKDTANRPALAQVFKDNVYNVKFVVAVNHLKSKGSACAGDPDLGDGQGNCNLTRKAAAQALVDWLANPTYFPEIEKALIIGDLNSYDKEDPIDAIKLGADDTADTADDYLDMIFEKRGEFAYGYVYDGQTGYLDHALANKALAENIVDVNFWHINADEPDIIDYDMTFKKPAQDALYAPDAYRSSDHDPVIATLGFFEITDADLLTSTDPATLEEAGTLLPGNLADGFTMNLDPTVPWYYLDTDTVTSNGTLANGSYPFFITDNPGEAFFAYWAEQGVVEGATGWQGQMWQIINGDAPMFYLKVDGETLSLIDGLQGDPNPLRVNGDYCPGLYTFSGTVMGSTGSGDQVEVSILFNTVPAADDQTVTTPEETPIDITLTATDPEGAPLTYTILDQPAHGTVTLNGATATYTPALNFNGTDSFTFKANDGIADSLLATVTVLVLPVNDAPVAVDDAYEVDEDADLTVLAAQGVLANDTDVDNDPLTAVLVTGPAHGTLVLAEDGSFVYTPKANFNGTDSFTYKATDGTLESNLATVTITVNPVNDWPVANDDEYEVVTGTVLEVAAPGVLGNDVLVDPDEQVSIQVLEGPQHGMLTLNNDGSFTYTPNAGYMGVDTFRYLVLSQQGKGEWSDDATVTITVKPSMSLFLPIIMR